MYPSTKHAPIHLVISARRMFFPQCRRFCRRFLPTWRPYKFSKPNKLRNLPLVKKNAMLSYVCSKYSVSTVILCVYLA